VPAEQTVTVAFRQFGSGPDLVLVMGQSGSMSWWDANLLQDLAPHYRVTLFDLPGIGWSGATSRFTPSVEGYADVTAGLLETLAIRRPMLVGWGMGGEVAMEVGLRHPGSAARLVLVDTSAGGPAAVPTPAPAAATLASADSTPAGLAHLLFPSGDSGDRAAWLLDLLHQGPDDVVASALAAQAGAQQTWWRNGPGPAQVNAISLPTMVVWGSADGVFPAADGSALASAIPGASAVTFAGAGYASLFQDPAAFVADLMAFAAS
jgi:pimeloyl-ACP methyl ester carboxylesterase